MLPFCNISMSEGGSLDGLRSKFKGPWKCEHRDLGLGELLQSPFAMEASVSAVSIRLLLDFQ